MGSYYARRAEQFPYESWVISVEDVQQEMKDINKKLHELFAGLTTEEDYKKCIIKAIEEFNEDLPITGVKFNPLNFAFPIYLIKAAFVQVLDELVMYHSLNRFSGTSGGVSVPVHEVDAIMMERDKRKAQVEQKRTALKTGLNYEEAWGNIEGPGGFGW